MKVLITGGTGFLGGHLVRRWLQRGEEVTVVSRNPERAARLFGGAVRTVALDRLQELPREGKPFDLVVNLAGAPLFRWPWPAHYKRFLFESRIRTTRRLVDYLSRVELRPDLLISGSAVGYYGNRGDELLDEASPPPPVADFGHELCAAWEEEARRAEELGVRVCLLRTGLILSRDGGLLARILPLARLGLLAQLGSGRQWLSWIHLEDYLRIYDFLIEREALSGPVNATAPEPVTQKAFAQALARALGRPLLLKLPERLLRLAAGELGELLLASQRVVPRKLLEYGFTFCYPTLDSALKALFSEK